MSQLLHKCNDLQFILLYTEFLIFSQIEHLFGYLWLTQFKPPISAAQNANTELFLSFEDTAPVTVYSMISNLLILSVKFNHAVLDHLRARLNVECWKETSVAYPVVKCLIKLSYCTRQWFSCFAVLFYRGRYLFRPKPGGVTPSEAFFRRLYPEVIQEIEVRYDL